MLQETETTSNSRSNNPFVDSSGAFPESRYAVSASGLRSNNPFDEGVSTNVDVVDSPDSSSSEVNYIGLESNVFKTSNRLVDDIKADLLFLIDPETGAASPNGILRSAPVTYSEKIASIKHNPYELYTLNQELPYLRFVEHKHSHYNPRSKITVIRALLFNNSQPSLSKSKVYHVKIQIKLKESSIGLNVSKNEFHLVETLNEQDAQDLVLGELANTDDPSVREALPKIVDEANYVCALTGKILRIEITEPEFDEEDLHDYEIGPINVRYNKALEDYEGLNPEIPSPSSCLNTLFRVLRGALLLLPEEEQKTISCSNRTLNSHINPQILTKRLLFEIKDNEFHSSNVSDPTDPNQAVIREAYERKISEVILLGTKAYSANHPSSFKAFQFTKALDTIFHQLDDNASIRHHEFIKQPYYINLSAYPFYSDDLIINCYQKSVDANPDYGPIYFDSIKEISQQKANYKLSSFVSKLISLNVTGQKDIDDAYKSLNVELSEAPLIDDDILLSLYKTERQKHPLDGRLRNSFKIIADQRKSDTLHRYLNYEPLPLSQAYDLLEIDERVDDDLVATAYMIKSDDNPNELKTYNRALITIATERKSFKLLDSVEKRFPDLYTPMKFEEACEYLGVDNTANEFQVINIFQMGSRDTKQARNALRVIAKEKNSAVIRSFLATGLIDHTFLPPEEWPVGLNNIGNTCYLNSLLQYYFSIKPLRDAVLSFEDVFTEEEQYENRRIGGRLVGAAEVERSFQFSYRLRDLFYDQIHASSRYITPTKELAYLAFMPVDVLVSFDYLSNSPEVINLDTDEKDENSPDSLLKSSADSIMDDNIDVNESDLIDLSGAVDSSGRDEVTLLEKDSSIDVDPSPSHASPTTDYVLVENKAPHGSVDNFMDSAEKRQKHEVPPSTSSIPSPVRDAKAAPISGVQLESSFEIGRQQDVTECIGNVLLQIEASMKPEGFYDDDKEQIDLVKRLFYGATVQHLTDEKDPKVKRDKVERFSAVFVNISDKPRNLYEAFDLVYKTEKVDNSYLVRSERITELPIILQIQIQRVYFDKEAMRVYKNIEQLAFPEALYMDRYFDTDDQDIIKRREDVDNWKQEIEGLKARRSKLLTKNEHGVSLKDSLKTTREWLAENQLAEPLTIEVLDEQVKKIDDELLKIYEKIQSLEHKIDHHFDGFQKHGYSIFAIFIHRGEANFGHYWIYIRDQKRNIYRKYNDEIVSEVPQKEVFNFTDGNTATPYFLGYVKNGHEHEIEPLCRSISSDNK